MTSDELIAFENDIAAEFAAARIAAPVHLNGGNERQMIAAFEDIASADYVLCSWRSHYACLLKGVPPAEVKAAIMRGRSIALCFPEYRILSSAIVGGICPIATGIGWAIKERKGAERVHCFIGDMTAMTGIYAECRRYCAGHGLPVRWIVEDNGLSVCTDTKAVWGRDQVSSAPHVMDYTMTRPHVGIGKFVRF